MDQVTLTNCDCSLFSLASVKSHQIQTCFENFVLPKLGLKGYKLPEAGECLSIPLAESDASTLLVVPTSGLPPCAGAGYTFCFLGDKATGESMWQYLTSEDCPEGPVKVGSLEFETLRIECGQPAFGKEMTGADEKDAVITPASPLELHLQSAINFEKGCYLGQEGIASMLKNPRGPPRTLYQVVFDDEFNIYDHQTKGEFTSKSTENLTRLPVKGDQLFVLGSNEEIAVGQITSVAEPAGTGEPVTLALALVRRPDSIQKQMKSMNLEMPRTTDVIDVQVGGSGLIPPPKLDPLDGLEVIIGGSYTVGTLKGVPSRRGKTIYDNAVPQFVENLPGEDVQRDIIDMSRPALGAIEPATTDAVDEAKLAAEVAKAEAEAEAAAAEAKRKAEKMEILRKRAEEAMLRRKQKKAGE
jgi:folate-binding protein YgfZ